MSCRAGPRPGLPTCGALRIRSDAEVRLPRPPRLPRRHPARGVRAPLAGTLLMLHAGRGEKETFGSSRSSGRPDAPARTQAVERLREPQPRTGGIRRRRRTDSEAPSSPRRRHKHDGRIEAPSAVRRNAPASPTATRPRSTSCATRAANRSGPVAVRATAPRAGARRAQPARARQGLLPSVKMSVTSTSKRPAARRAVRGPDRQLVEDREVGFVASVKRLHVPQRRCREVRPAPDPPPGVRRASARPGRDRATGAFEAAARNPRPRWQWRSGSARSELGRPGWCMKHTALRTLWRTPRCFASRSAHSP